MALLGSYGTLVVHYNAKGVVCMTPWLWKLPEPLDGFGVETDWFFSRIDEAIGRRAPKEALWYLKLLLDQVRIHTYIDSPREYRRGYVIRLGKVWVFRHQEAMDRLNGWLEMITNGDSEQDRDIDRYCFQIIFYSAADDSYRLGRLVDEICAHPDPFVRINAYNKYSAGVLLSQAGWHEESLRILASSRFIDDFGYMVNLIQTGNKAALVWLAAIVLEDDREDITVGVSHSGRRVWAERIPPLRMWAKRSGWEAELNALLEANPRWRSLK
jgi:hypothetical protein